MLFWYYSKRRELTHIPTLRRDIFHQATSCSTRSVSGHSDTCAHLKVITTLSTRRDTGCEEDKHCLKYIGKSFLTYSINFLLIKSQFYLCSTTKGSYRRTYMSIRMYFSKQLQLTCIGSAFSVIHFISNSTSGIPR